MSCKENKIAKNMIIADILKQYPETIKVFKLTGMHCLGCSSATSETVAQAAFGHGVNLDDLLEKLNQAVCEKN